MKSGKTAAVISAAVMAFSFVSPSAVSAADKASGFMTGAENFISPAEMKFFAAAPKVGSKEEAAAYVREQLKKRAEFISVNVPLNCFFVTNADAAGILANAIGETDKGDEGDYIRFAIRSYKYDYEGNRSNTTFYYSLTYYSPAEDEQAVADALEACEPLLQYEGRSDYEKICIAYDYITSRVKYAEFFDDDRIFTAYGALIDQNCVCQGYALLLYRMLKDMGVDCRIISGTSGGERHAWNIVRLGDRYFYLDPTWDSLLGGSDGVYFLRGSEDFDDFDREHAHIPVYEYEEVFPDYESAEFKSMYPAANTSFILGDANGDRIIDGNDASYILTCYAAMSVNNDFSMPALDAAAGDITGDRIVDGNDASGLLSYYAAVSTGKKLSLKQYINDIQKKKT